VGAQEPLALLERLPMSGTVDGRCTGSGGGGRSPSELCSRVDGLGNTGGESCFGSTAPASAVLSSAAARSSATETGAGARGVIGETRGEAAPRGVS
jgi:hypothetical protein